MFRAINYQGSQRWFRKLEGCCWLVSATALVFFATTLGLRAQLTKEAEQIVLGQSQSTWSSGQKQRFQQLSASAIPPIVGVPNLPSQSTMLPIFDEESEVAQTLGVAHLNDSAPLDASGNIALSSHRDGPFRVLQKLQIGDPILLLTDSGERRFSVSKVSIGHPSAVNVLAPTHKPILTLITCFPFYFVGEAPQRFVIQAVAISPSTRQPTRS